MNRTTWILVASGVVLGVMGVAVIGMYQAAQQVPDFYRDALAVDVSQHEQAGDELERQVLQLHNATRRDGRWQVVLTDQQINGWLAADLPKKFPHLVPRGVRDPRVVIDPDGARLACFYDSGKVQAVVSLALEIQLTDEPNVVAVRVEKARAGALPLPLKNFLDRIVRAARDADIQLRWRQSDGDPVALVTVPRNHDEYTHREIHLDQIELRNGEVYLSGRTQREPVAGHRADRGTQARPTPRTGSAGRLLATMRH